MTLLETLLKPLLNAQREAGEALGRKVGEALGRKAGEALGREEGRAQANAEFEAWKARQREAGVAFVDEDNPTEIPPASDE